VKTEWLNRGVFVAFFFFVAALAHMPPPVAAQEPPVDYCSSCHSALDERLSAPVTAFATDIHSERGLTCVSCHGGDATAAGLAGMDPAKGFVGKPGAERTPEFCGRCHSDAQFMRQYNPSIRVDQVTEYVTSVHGRRLAELGDTAVATCTSCHPAHSIRPPTDPLSSVNPLNVAETCGACHANAEYMAEYPIPTDQLERYQRSVHWEMMSVERDLSAPTCNDCHGNHGAAPPGISWVGNVCGQCHSVMADNFSQSRHAQTFAMLGMPGCATCHQNHDIVRASDEMLGLGEGAVCARCHAEGDTGGEAATAMRSLIDSLGSSFEAADSILGLAEQAGMEVSEAQFELGRANNAAVQARASMHAFSVEAVRENVEEGLGITLEAHQRGQGALAELQFRRTGLAISVTIIVVLIVGLVLRIRQLEHKRQTT
jgi:hypothetical protein